MAHHEFNRLSTAILLFLLLSHSCLQASIDLSYSSNMILSLPQLVLRLCNRKLGVLRCAGKRSALILDLGGLRSEMSIKRSLTSLKARQYRGGMRVRSIMELNLEGIVCAGGCLLYLLVDLAR